MTNRIGLCTIAFKEKSLRDIISIASAAGADCIEVWAQPDQVSYPFDPAECSGVRDYAASLGIEIAALGSYCRPGSRVEYNGVEAAPENQVELAGLFGTDLIRIWPGNVNFADAGEAERADIIDGIREIADLAARSDTSIVLERHCNSLTDSWDAPAQVLEMVDRPNVTLNYQTVYPAPAEELIEKGKDDYWKYLPVSSHAHMQNYLKNPAGELPRCFLDEGIVDYSELSGAAEAAGYTGAFMVEFLPDDIGNLTEAEALKRDIEYLRSL